MSFAKDLTAELREATGIEKGDLAKGVARGLGRALSGEDDDGPPVIVVKDDAKTYGGLPDWAPIAGVALLGLAILAVKK